MLTSYYSKFYNIVRISGSLPLTASYYKKFCDKFNKKFTEDSFSKMGIVEVVKSKNSTDNETYMVLSLESKTA